MIDALPLLLSDEGYQISRSVRLRSSASAYFNRTPGSATNRRTFTLSKWLKRGALGTNQALFSASDGTQSNEFLVYFTTSDTLGIQQTVGGTASGQISCITNAVFRDPSSWYHIVLAIDTNQATSTNRLLLYVNGVAQTFSSYSVGSSINTWVNNTNAHAIGKRADASLYLDGYLTEVNFIDGQALTPSSFGETNPVTGVWQPKKYAGTYGTNGFYLNFSDNSAATAAAIGKDYSGNGNNWTPNNISVTAGVTYDSMLDVPTQWADGGNGRGNYATLNPLDYVAAAFSGTASNGNLTISIPAPTNSNGLASTIRVVSAAQSKFYIETTVTSLNTVCSLGMISGTNANYRLRHTADITLAVNDVVMTAFDPATGNVWYGRNGSWLSSGNPAAGTNPFYTIPAAEIVGSAYCILATNGSTGTFTTSTTFGQQPFTYTPPTGFKALNTLNLPAPTILKGNQYFDATLWTGNGSTQSIVNSGAMQPDLVWYKRRNSADNNRLFDSVRGVTKPLFSDLTNAESTESGVTAFNSNGFSLGLAGNESSNTYVGWQWKEGATQGFDIVTYTGTGSSTTVAHNLGVAPAMIIAKNRSAAADWYVAFAPLAGWTWSSDYLLLNGTGAKQTNGGGTVFPVAPTSSVFTVGGAATNTNGNNYVAYLFAAVAGYSAFGSYTGNGSADGPFIFTGFRPRFILFKKTSATDDWVIYDTARDEYNVASKNLYPNGSFAEDSNTTNRAADILSNGFKLRSSGTFLNGSGATFIYAAFAEVPFRNSLAR